MISLKFYIKSDSRAFFLGVQKYVNSQSKYMLMSQSNRPTSVHVLDVSIQRDEYSFFLFLLFSEL
jgi:hypothetical protein